MRKSKLECLLNNGVMAHDLGKSEKSVLKEMDDYAESALKENSDPKVELKWLMDKYENCSERYIEAEKFIMNLKWYERIFISRKVLKFLKSRTIKYNF
jgi:hypothetical protein